MNHLVAVLVFTAALLLWFAVQRLAGRRDDAGCESCEQTDCAGRAVGDPDPPRPREETASPR